MKKSAVLFLLLFCVSRDEEITTSTSARIAIRMIVCTVLGC